VKYLSIILILIVFGCLQKRSLHKSMEASIAQEVKQKPVLIEVNSVPPPFDLAGNNPYVVWMNGRKVNLPKEDLTELVNKVGEENIPSIDLMDIHKGWLRPHYAKKEEFPENRGRVRQVKTKVN
jgi:hypothetical protein